MTARSMSCLFQVYAFTLTQFIHNAKSNCACASFCEAAFSYQAFACDSSDSHLHHFRILHRDYIELDMTFLCRFFKPAFRLSIILSTPLPFAYRTARLTWARSSFEQPLFHTTSLHAGSLGLPRAIVIHLPKQKLRINIILRSRFSYHNFDCW